MSRLDRYVARIVAGAFGAALLFFLFLSILVDLLNNLATYAEKNLGVLELAVFLAQYYAKMLPVFFTMVTPFATVIACMFALARLQHANEIVPMLFVGRSVQRVLRPMLLCGALAGASMAACWQWVVPHFGIAIAADRLTLGKSNSAQENLVLDTHGDVSHYLHVAEFLPATATMRNVSMLVEGQLHADAVLVTATSAVWDPKVGDWRLHDGRGSVTHGSSPQEWLERPDLPPDVLLQRSRHTIAPEFLSYTELVELSVARPNSYSVRFALHRHITAPLANLILLLLALPMAVWYERGSRIGRLLVAIGLCGAFLLFDLICQSLGQLHPVVAAWMPTIVFGSLGIVLFSGAKT